MRYKRDIKNMDKDEFLSFVENERKTDREVRIGAFLIVAIAAGVIAGFVIVRNVKYREELNAGINKASNIVITPMDKLDAECFSTNATYVDESLLSYTYADNKFQTLEDVYCKPDTDSDKIRHKYGINQTIYAKDVDAQILYAKEMKEGNGIFYFDISEDLNKGKEK